MKWITAIITLLLICLLNSVCFANYFDDNSDRFMLYVSSNRYTAYIDLNSISVIKYDPPNYVIQGEEYFFDSARALGMKSTERIFYNYDTKNIYAEILECAGCDKNGNLSEEEIYEEGTNPYITLNKNFSGYYTARLIFAIAYGVPFVPVNDNSEKRKEYPLSGLYKY